MIVVDAAVVVDALVLTDGAHELRGFMAQHELNAPTLLDYEVISAVRGLTMAGRLSVARAEDFLTDFDDLPITRWSSSHSLRRRAFQLRDNVSAYDAAYVVLAEALGCPLLTRDARLSRSSGHSARIEVH